MAIANQSPVLIPVFQTSKFAIQFLLLFFHGLLIWAVVSIAELAFVVLMQRNIKSTCTFVVVNEVVTKRVGTKSYRGNCDIYVLRIDVKSYKQPHQKETLVRKRKDMLFSKRSCREIWPQFAYIWNSRSIRHPVELEKLSVKFVELQIRVTASKISLISFAMSVMCEL